MNEFVVIPAFILAGLIWNNLGYFSDWRKNKDDPAWKGFESKKLRDDLILGVILGVVAYFYGIYQGESFNIDSLQAFIVIVVGAFGPVAAVDKLIVGGILKK